ncbi:MAG: TadE/TadG family type IV pilus assembly protein [Anaerolineae bacterium]
MLTNRPFRRRQRGASLVELALVLFILLLILAAIVDFGRVFNHYVVITNASREGARYASRFSNHERGILDAAIAEAAQSSVQLKDENIEIDPDPGENGETAAPPGDPITVTVKYKVPTIIADIAGFGELPLQARTQMVVFYDGQDED